MKKNRIETTSDHIKTRILCLIIMILFSVALPVAVKTTTSLGYASISADYQVGEISDKNVYAKNSIDLIDTKKTEQLKEEASTNVLPIFTYSPTKSLKLVDKVDKVRNAIANNDLDTASSYIGSTLSQKLMELADSEIFSISYDIVKDISDRGLFEAYEITQIKEEGYSKITLSNQITNSGTVTYEQTLNLGTDIVLTTETVSSYISQVLLDLSDSIDSKQILLAEEFIFSVLEPNISYDEELTSRRREEARDSITPVIISITKGDVLIAENRVVTSDQMDILNMLAAQSGGLTLLEIAGWFVFDAVGIFAVFYVFGMLLGKKDLHFQEYHILFAIGFVISIITTYFLVLLSSRLNIEFTDSYLPVFFLPLFITMVTGHKRLGFVAVFMLGLVASTLPTATVMTFFYCIICGSACVLLIRFFNKRIDMIYQWFFSCIICSAVCILFFLIEGIPVANIFVSLIGVLFNVSIAYILLAVLMPLVERIFNLPTIFRLYELAYGTSPLLERLSQAAPGTYSHSRAVADLADAGARAIGANALLARVGGLYHDIGKIEHPEYFVENQSGVNKHDDISPSLSVAVIKSHVKVGADKAREAGLPLEVVKIVSDHHGNDVIQFFFHEALEAKAASQDGKGEEVKASDYSYNADIPDFPECAIVMLADSIEAASRTVTPNAGKFAKLIESIFMGKIERGQLDKCGLTMNDIKTLGDSFVKTLVARYHSRIEYPDDDED